MSTPASPQTSCLDKRLRWERPNYCRACHGFRANAWRPSRCPRLRLGNEKNRGQSQASPARVLHWPAGEPEGSSQTAHTYDGKGGSFSQSPSASPVKGLPREHADQLPTSHSAIWTSQLHPGTKRPQFNFFDFQKFFPPPYIYIFCDWYFCVPIKVNQKNRVFLMTKNKIGFLQEPVNETRKA